ncbi:hypothetical protein LOC68_05480 [Blastopirellula sp. JC732]|uniref:Uncharacterized protein n=1 Tax=Blastopirellula sediminis TaxID=2894196 RepID=A0A9X1SI76_9BACT|nr:hypothetical protein [Blastopirellula sediminis]MCC9609384.1 hypothetical protein [Blastopirellula sediminis]MCC9627839.1 hypothetical protein [Blastopirellula sediminis]
MRRHYSSRRGFLRCVGSGTLLATLGGAAFDMALIPRAFANELDGELTFGDLEPLVRELQETGVDRLQRSLVVKLNSGVSLQTLTGAAALANARTFGGEDYIGFHTFMALAPALKMSGLLKGPEAALPVMKVLYRNTDRIQEFGGRASEVLHQITMNPTEVGDVDAAELHHAVRDRQVDTSEQLLAQLVNVDRVKALNALIPLVHDSPEVHRTVLPYRAWDMQEIVGTEHALTLLRQSLRYCLQSEKYRRDDWSEHAAMLGRLFDEYKLQGLSAGRRKAADEDVHRLSRVFAEATPSDAARAAAEMLADGFAPTTIGEALSLAASRLVLLDGGRQPQWESPGKPAGCVHGDSVGVHASDAANAWRNLATATTDSAALSCLIIGAWQVARDRDASPNLLDDSLPTERHLGEITAQGADDLLNQLDEAIRFNQQAHATAIAHRYGELNLPADRIFLTLLKYAVSEDGALHAEKYFQTVRDDFQSTRPAYRWQHVSALARVTASEYGRPAAGQAEARELLRVGG